MSQFKTFFRLLNVFQSLTTRGNIQGTLPGLIVAVAAIAGFDLDEGMITEIVGLGWAFAMALYGLRDTIAGKNRALEKAVTTGEVRPVTFPTITVPPVLVK